MIISTDAEKDFEIIQQTSMIKTRGNIEGTYFNIVKVIYDKPKEEITLSDEKLTVFPLRSGTRQRFHPCHHYSIQFWKSEPWQSERKKK